MTNPSEYDDGNGMIMRQGGEPPLANERVSEIFEALEDAIMAKLPDSMPSGQIADLIAQAEANAQALCSPHQGEVEAVAYLMKCESGPYAGEYEVVEQNSSHPNYSAPFPVYLQPSVPKAREVTDEMVERAAEAVWLRAGSDYTWSEAVASPECAIQVEWTREDARAALTAALVQP